MRNIVMSICYDGTAYYGFQSQPGGNTIQDYIEAAIEQLTGENIILTSSGRTDAGVHARSQIINFQTASSIPLERWAFALNSRLPPDIRILEARMADPDFHARRWAKRKTYRYTINHNRIPDVFQRHMQFHHPASLDVEAMRHALQTLVGEHDFTSFCSVKSTKPSHVRTIYEVSLELDPHVPGVIHIFVTGNGFLQHMVRIIVGTLLQIGEGKRSAEDMSGILAARSRSKAGPTAMSHGLMLWDVVY
ncbi:tRNA pseudouridine(38-40) synthase TruA [Paenibacillus ginsengarvi]|uniref:tRNA pseudouridine synthase A n=1 Tax=Paenibacillus ginsengarvi TaxID=400777 RepID=A0A3B0AXT5_9BACL|nr:tRNA pseudouridine(38-40) synthase TruA [Paenibacillus ginsengarvi]RKN65222.1 tRNA pseudouridine(38-40) synthase TruA [Paenibacillus ginsengarvi]